MNTHETLRRSSILLNTTIDEYVDVVSLWNIATTKISEWAISEPNLIFLRIWPISTHAWVLRRALSSVIRWPNNEVIAFITALSGRILCGCQGRLPLGTNI